MVKEAGIEYALGVVADACRQAGNGLAATVVECAARECEERVMRLRSIADRVKAEFEKLGVFRLCDYDQEFQGEMTNVIALVVEGELKRGESYGKDNHIRGKKVQS